MSIHQISKWLNPMVYRWINYYARFHKSAMKAIDRHLNLALVKWTRRKYKGLQRHKLRACQFITFWRRIPCSLGQGGIRSLLSCIEIHRPSV
ncbi:group II intron maturase-specific domain-containing protein [Oceanisphaera sp. IT1-181]|uniref:group II intron maturase-specific domain-containing protein n=1 Tax=Oceanisphaera sp. IT1-181 TaxID=3081199 RepID=UPI0029CA9821|nr:group II intron maturase-specific domain-containing protein [Oceanisphaera sp. IT1-181]